MDSGYDNSAPLYDQVRLRILADLKAGRYAAGAHLPAEGELCGLYGVSRITLRRAVSDLCAEGILKKVHGRGTFVTAPKLQQALISLSGFTEALQEQGINSRYSVIRTRIEASGTRALQALAGRAGDAVVSIGRILMVDERPLTLENLFFLERRFGRVADAVRDGASFYATLRAIYDEGPHGAERTINVEFPTREEAELLESALLQPVFRIEKTVLGESGAPIAFSRLTTPTDRVTYTLRA